jgi:hypothetical protein
VALDDLPDFWFLSEVIRWMKREEVLKDRIISQPAAPIDFEGS